jgi:hypothetical protein
MIVSREEMPEPDIKIEIDLLSPQGNAMYLLGLVDDLGKKLNIPIEIRKDIKNVMMMGSYEDLIETFDVWFGKYVILYK